MYSSLIGEAHLVIEKKFRYEWRARRWWRRFVGPAQGGWYFTLVCLPSGVVSAEEIWGVGGSVAPTPHPYDWASERADPLGDTT